MSAIGMKYGEFNLQTDEVYVADTNIYSGAQRKIQSDELAEEDGTIPVDSKIGSKTITLDIVLRGNTVERTDQLLDEFKTALYQPNQALDVEYGGDIRRYICSLTNMAVTRKRGLMSCVVSVELYCHDGVASDTYNSTLLPSSHVTTGSMVFTIRTGGSYKAQPLITLTVNTVGGAANKTVTILNSVVLRGIGITRTWAVGDKLEIDCMKKTVFVNNEPHDFEGQFPEWAPGRGGVQVKSNFTSRDLSIVAFYARRYL